MKQASEDLGSEVRRDLDRTAGAVASTRLHAPLTLVTLGPAGTSADAAAAALDRALGAAGTSNQRLLVEDFAAVLTSLVTGEADIALVPSASRDATAFHWHPDVRLVDAFVYRTPDYGLAVAPNTDLGSAGSITLAAMPEVAALYRQLAPAALAGIDVVHRSATSTSAAAEMVGAGTAQIAVCNDLGRTRYGLVWLRHRAGAEIVWMVFRRAVAAPPPE